MARRTTWVLLLSVLGPLFFLPTSWAQHEKSSPGGRPRSEEPRGKDPEKKPGEQSGAKGPGEETPKDKDDEKKPDAEASDSIQRPDAPPRVPDPREFDVTPNEEGRLRFSFYGQGWPDILQWLASISDYSLDWQELPKDYVNISTTRSYTVPETRDVFNRLLLDRGYTMLEQGHVLSVVKTSELEPSLLPTVRDEAELMDLLPHSFVKIAFELPEELAADKLVEDVKPLLSPNAKAEPLLATNRLLVIDAVANLREVSRLVNTEHAAAIGRTVPEELMIRHARADQVADQVMILLGLDPSSRRTPQELQVEHQRLQLFQKMQQKGKDVTKYLRKGEGPSVFLTVNDRTNSILVNAPPAEMKIIKEAVKRLDVPSASAAGELAGTLSLEKYQLVTISPQAIVTALQDIGDLDPCTRLRTDSETKTVFAHATAHDHQKIQTMIDRLDGTGRQLEVIWLRRLPALAVATTLTNLMVGKKEEEESSGRRSMFYYPSPSRRQTEQPKPQFRVDADVERNRLLLWATEAELKEVREFLEKMGEIPGRSGNPHTVRFLAPRSQDDMLKTLDQVRRVWRGDNELRIERRTPVQEKGDADEVPAEERSDSKDDRAAHIASRPAYRLAANLLQPSENPRGAAAQVESGDNGAVPLRQGKDKSPAAAEQKKASITITTTADGRIVLQSEDTTALDEIEDLIASLTPPAADFKIFYLDYASASMVTLNLEEYFEEQAELDTAENWRRAYYGFDSERSTPGDRGLGQQRKIRFIYDYDTNSILVANASPSQLEIVETLIELYDVPPSEDSISARKFEMFTLKYARAGDVASTIKDVFRDLLSAKDRDFDQRGEQKQENSQSRGYYRILFAGGGSDDQKPTKVRASFEGALSVGVDDVSNAVIVSAQEEWMTTIAKMVEFLDENARPRTEISVVKVSSHVNAKSLREALTNVAGEDRDTQQHAETKEKSERERQEPRQPERPRRGGPRNSDN